MTTNFITAVSLPSDMPDSAPNFLDFDQIRMELGKLNDKTAYEAVKLVRQHSTKEKLMKLITDRVEPNTIPSIDTIANIVISISDKYLGADEAWI